MMRERRPLMLMLMLALGLVWIGSAGCTDNVTVTLHEPGVYKGSEDPLRALQEDPEQRKALEERFLRGQTDRQSGGGTG